jgi:hypothetical protein
MYSAYYLSYVIFLKPVFLPFTLEVKSANRYEVQKRKRLIVFVCGVFDWLTEWVNQYLSNSIKCIMSAYCTKHFFMNLCKTQQHSFRL